MSKIWNHANHPRSERSVLSLRWTVGDASSPAMPSFSHTSLLSRYLLYITKKIGVLRDVAMMVTLMLLMMMMLMLILQMLMLIISFVTYIHVFRIINTHEPCIQHQAAVYPQHLQCCFRGVQPLLGESYQVSNLYFLEYWSDIKKVFNNRSPETPLGRIGCIIYKVCI